MFCLPIFAPDSSSPKPSIRSGAFSSQRHACSRLPRRRARRERSRHPHGPDGRPPEDHERPRRRRPVHQHAHAGPHDGHELDRVDGLLRRHDRRRRGARGLHVLAARGVGRREPVPRGRLAGAQGDAVRLRAGRRHGTRHDRRLLGALLRDRRAVGRVAVHEPVPERRRPEPPRQGGRRRPLEGGHEDLPAVHARRLAPHGRQRRARVPRALGRGVVGPRPQGEQKRISDAQVRAALLALLPRVEPLRAVQHGQGVHQDARRLRRQPDLVPLRRDLDRDVHGQPRADHDRLAARPARLEPRRDEPPGPQGLRQARRGLRGPHARALPGDRPRRDRPALPQGGRRQARGRRLRRLRRLERDARAARGPARQLRREPRHFQRPATLFESL